MGKALETRKLADVAMCTVSHTHCTCRRLATMFETELNEGFGGIHQLVAVTATATSSTFMGTGYRADNEHEYLLKSLDLLAKMLNEEDTGDGFEVVTTEK